MEKFSTFFGLKLSHLIFAATEQLAITLQNQDITLQEAIMASTLAEQSSTLRRLKTFLQSTMSQPRLNHVMILHIHKDKTDQVLTLQKSSFL